MKPSLGWTCGRPSVLVCSYKSAQGWLDIKRPSSSFDLYKRVQNLDLEQFQVFMKPNIAYDANRYITNSDIPITNKQSTMDIRRHQRTSALKKLQKNVSTVARFLTGRPRRSSHDDDEMTRQWIGLKRYVGSLEDDIRMYDTMSNNEEYAKYSLILDTVSTTISYYYDIPGTVTSKSTNIYSEFGVDIVFSQATIHYGAWADKQRVPLQSMFFPTVARDSEPSKPQSPGDLRQYNGFRMNITTHDEIIFRIPTREPSKDKEVLNGQTLNNLPHNTTKTTRSFGWLELKLGPNSTIGLFTAFTCLKEKGWINQITAGFNLPEVRSSVNHDVVFVADSHSINADVGFPLEWNGKCNWTFDNHSRNAKFFFLREHTLLLSDIFTDFASGDPIPYEQFKLFDYNLNWDFDNYFLYLNVNELFFM